MTCDCSETHICGSETSSRNSGHRLTIRSNDENLDISLEKSNQTLGALVQKVV